LTIINIKKKTPATHTVRWASILAGLNKKFMYSGMASTLKKLLLLLLAVVYQTTFLQLLHIKPSTKTPNRGKSNGVKCSTPAIVKCLPLAEGLLEWLDVFAVVNHAHTINAVQIEYKTT